MNEAHERCGGEEWRQTMRDVILPSAVGDLEVRINPYGWAAAARRAG